MTDDGGGERVDGETVRTFREARELSQGRLDVDHDDVLPTAAIVRDDAHRQLLHFMQRSWDGSGSDDLPNDFWDTKFGRHALEQAGTRTMTQAVNDGNISQTSYMTGLPSYRSDVSGLHALQQLGDWLFHSEQCKLIYIAALMGRGKTDLSCLMMEVVNWQYQRIQASADEFDRVENELPFPEFAANFAVNATDDGVHVEEIRTERALLDWAEGGSSDDIRWFIFDEASTELTAQSGANAQNVAETFAPFVKKMRKKGINLIVIGHDKNDVHPAVRALADYVDKPSLKSAEFYAGISNREPTGELFTVDGVPETSWEYDTDDTAEWTWMAEEDEGDGGVPMVPESEVVTDDELRDMRDERMARVYDATDVSQSALADAFGVSQTTVSNAIRSFENNTSQQQAAGD